MPASISRVFSRCRPGEVARPLALRSCFFLPATQPVGIRMQAHPGPIRRGPAAPEGRRFGRGQGTGSSGRRRRILPRHPRSRASGPLALRRSDGGEAVRPPPGAAEAGAVLVPCVRRQPVPCRLAACAPIVRHPVELVVDSSGPAYPFRQCVGANRPRARARGRRRVLTQHAASSHREAPFIATQPQHDATDFYMFRSYEPGRQDYVVLVANYLPIQSTYGGPNFFKLDSNGVYEIHVVNNSSARRTSRSSSGSRTRSPTTSSPSAASRCRSRWCRTARPTSAHPARRR